MDTGEKEGREGGREDRERGSEGKERKEGALKTRPLSTGSSQCGRKDAAGPKYSQSAVLGSRLGEGRHFGSRGQKRLTVPEG